MWLYSNKPHKFSRAAEVDPVENEDSTGFPDLIDHARVIGWLCLIGFLGFAALVMI